MPTFYHRKPLSASEKETLRRRVAPFSIDVQNVPRDDGFVAGLMTTPNSVVCGLVSDAEHDLPIAYSAALASPNCRVETIQHTRPPNLAPAVMWRIPKLRCLTLNLDLYRNFDLFSCLATSDIASLHLLNMPTLDQQNEMVDALPRMRGLVELGLYQEPPRLREIVSNVLPKLNTLVLRNIRSWHIDLSQSPLTKLTLDAPFDLDGMASNGFSTVLIDCVRNSRVTDLVIYIDDAKIPHSVMRIGVVLRNKLVRFQISPNYERSMQCDTVASANGFMAAALLSVCGREDSRIETLDLSKFAASGSLVEVAIERLFHSTVSVLRNIRMNLSHESCQQLINELLKPRKMVHILLSVDLNNAEFGEFFQQELRNFRRQRNLMTLVAACLEDPGRMVPLDVARMAYKS